MVPSWYFVPIQGPILDGPAALTNVIGYNPHHLSRLELQQHVGVGASLVSCNSARREEPAGSQ